MTLDDVDTIIEHEGLQATYTDTYSKLESAPKLDDKLSLSKGGDLAAGYVKFALTYFPTTQSVDPGKEEVRIFRRDGYLYEVKWSQIPDGQQVEFKKSKINGRNVDGHIEVVPLERGVAITGPGDKPESISGTLSHSAFDDKKETVISDTWRTDKEIHRLTNEILKAR